MRRFGVVMPQFWTGKTGKAIKAEPYPVRILATYLITAPYANMIGLYYLPWLMVEHETGLPEQESLAAMATLTRLGFAKYDTETEMVWVPKMAKHQIGDSLKEKDNTRKTVTNMVRGLPANPFLAEFCALYGGSYRLDPSIFERGSETPLEGVHPDPAPDPDLSPDLRGRDHKDFLRLVERLQMDSQLSGIIGTKVPRDYLNRLLAGHPYDKIDLVASDLSRKVAGYTYRPKPEVLRQWLAERCDQYKEPTAVVSKELQAWIEGKA